MKDSTQKNSKQNVKDSIQEDMNQDNDLSSNESISNETANKDSIEPKTDEEGSAKVDLNTELTKDEAKLTRLMERRTRFSSPITTRSSKYKRYPAA